MDRILLCTNHIPTVTSIYNTFIEHYMPTANGSYVKVYLYLAKCLQASERDLSISTLADRMENTEKDILRALLYWEKKKLLCINRDAATGEITGLEMLIPEEDLNNKDSTVRPEPQIQAVPLATEISLRNNDKAIPDCIEEEDEIAVSQAPAAMENMAFHTPAVNENDDTAAPETPEAATESSAKKRVVISVSPQQLQDLSSDGDFIWVCNVVESYLDRPMKPNELQLVAYLYGTLHFSTELILHLYDYCISMGKANSSYIQTVALSWHEQGITTPEEAQTAVVRFHASYNAVSKALALGRSLAEIEKKFVDRWQNDWRMDLSVIVEACNRTVLKLHHADFKYTEGILSHWKEENVHTLQDVEKSDADYAQTKTQTPSNKKAAVSSGQTGKPRNQFQNFKQRDINTEELQELEHQLLMQ